MRVTVELDDQLVANAQKDTGIMDLSLLIDHALREMVVREAGRRLAALGGTDPTAKAPPRKRGWSTRR